MIRIRKLTDRDALRDWDEYISNYSTPEVHLNETPLQKAKRIKFLLGDFEEFCYYYFPKITKAKFAKWHKKFAKYLIEADNDITMAVAMVSRDMAKSSVTSLIFIHLYYKKEFKSLGLFSHNADNAIDLIKPIKIALEKNARLIADFGYRPSLGSWKAKRFVTTDNVSFSAFGAGQSPRGGKTTDSNRYDVLIFDDFDDVEVCRSKERLAQNWKYVTGDCIPAMHVSGKKRVVFLNNKIAEDSIIQKAWDLSKTAFAKTTKRIKVNLVDAEGHSNWPEAYSDEQCQDMINLAEDEASTEYMNDPIDYRGEIFQPEWFQFKKMPPMSKYKIMVAYLDGGFKKTRHSDTKALVLIGFMDGEYHIRKVYVDNVTVESMIAWHYDLWEWLKQKAGAAMWWMEEVFLLGLLHDDFDAAVETYGFRIPLMGDKRQKPDKDLRIAATSGKFERGKVWFCESLRHDRYAKRLISQYIRFKVGVKNNEKDGPDAVEGAFHLIDEQAHKNVNDIKTTPRGKNKHKI